MRIRAITCLAVSLVVLAALPAALLYGQQPAQEGADGKPVQPALDVWTNLNLSRALSRANGAGAELFWEVAVHNNPVGIDVVDVEPALRAQLGLPESGGVVVTAIKPESEVSRSGLEQYDIVLKLGEQAVSDRKQFDDLITAEQGKTIEMRVLRKGKPAKVQLKLPNLWLSTALQEQTVELSLANALVSEVQQHHYRIGVTLAEADDTLRSQLRLAAGEGLVVTDVLSDTPAARAGVRKHDVLVKLDGKRLTTVEAVNTQIQEIKDRSVTLALVRAGGEISIEVAPQLTKESNYLGAVESNYRDSVLRHLQNLVEQHEAVRERKSLLFQAADAERKAAQQAPPSPQPAARQIAELRKQLIEIQKSLEALEASLQQSQSQQPQAPEQPQPDK